MGTHGSGGDEVNSMVTRKNMQFWRAQQQLPRKQRVTHASRFNPEADVERAIEAIAGTHWGDAAQDRRRRQELSLTFLERFDVPWATGKQLALTDNLLPRSRRGPPTHGYCNCSGMMGPPDNVVMHPQGNRHQPHNRHTFPPSSRPQGGGGDTSTL